MGKLILLVVGALALACGADWDEAIDEHTSSSEGDPSEKAAPSESADDTETVEACNQEDVDVSSPEAALAGYARLRNSTPCTVEVTRRGKQVTVEYSIE